MYVTKHTHTHTHTSYKHTVKNPLSDDAGATLCMGTRTFTPTKHTPDRALALALALTLYIFV